MEKVDHHIVGKVVLALTAHNAYVATKFVSRTLVVRATRRLFKRKLPSKSHNIEAVLTIGRPNYLERDFIKLCLKAREPFPVKAIQLRFPPRQKKNK